MSEELVARLRAWLQRAGDGARRLVALYHPESLRSAGLLRAAAAVVALILVVLTGIGLYWSREPASFNVVVQGQALAEESGGRLVTGYVTVATLERVADTLMNKPGGYLSNDVTPPSVWLDNIPNWEFGVLLQVRDLARALRNDWSRSQSQSLEDRDLAEADPQFSFNSESWMFPPSEGEYRKGIRALRRYRIRLNDDNAGDGLFYARADNLAAWLAVVEKRLGSLSQRLSASVGRPRLNTDLAGDREATSAKARPSELEVKTPWLEIDDVFYEARGTAWALIHFLRAAEHDFGPVLQKKNAQISLRQIIRELEATQETVWSPMILNGSGLGLLANHSLVMASYISRANAAVIDLRALLSQG